MREQQVKVCDWTAVWPTLSDTLKTDFVTLFRTARIGSLGLDQAKLCGRSASCCLFCIFEWHFRALNFSPFLKQQPVRQNADKKEVPFRCVLAFAFRLEIASINHGIGLPGRDRSLPTDLSQHHNGIGLLEAPSSAPRPACVPQRTLMELPSRRLSRLEWCRCIENRVKRMECITACVQKELFL